MRGVDKCKKCGNWIDFDTEMLASESRVKKVSPLDSLYPSAVVVDETTNEEEVEGATEETEEVVLHHVQGRIDNVIAVPKETNNERFIDIQNEMISTIPESFQIYTHHPSAESYKVLFEAMKEACQLRIESDNRVAELVDFYAARHRKSDWSKLLTAEVTERAKKCELDLPEFDDIVSRIAFKTVCLQKEIERKDNLLALYKNKKKLEQIITTERKLRKSRISWGHVIKIRRRPISILSIQKHLDTKGKSLCLDL